MHRILLIDDDELLAPPLAAYLRRFDFDLHAALRPSQGLALLAAGAGIGTATGIDTATAPVTAPVTAPSPPPASRP